MAVTENMVGPGSAYTMFRPQTLGQAGLKHPVITWGNGTGTMPSTYSTMLTHYASHGFVVIASNSTNVAQGTPPPMLDGVTWVLEQAGVTTSPLYNCIDAAKIGATGHSQGAFATVTAGADPRIVTIAPLQGSGSEQQSPRPRRVFLRRHGHHAAVQRAHERVQQRHPVPGDAGQSAGRDPHQLDRLRIDPEPLRRRDHRLVPRAPDGRYGAAADVLRRELQALSGHRNLADPAQDDGLSAIFAWHPAWHGLRCAALVIRLDSVSKQHGKQILFLEASLSVFRGERVALVGPNGSGKTTIFRMITGEEPPDGGQVMVDRGVSIGYFSQDVGEMAGRSVVEETTAGAGEVSEIGHELHGLEHAMADPARADELDSLIERFGVVQARFDELGGYALEARAREILKGLGFADEIVDDDVAKLSGGWKMRVALARILLMRPDALLLDEPTNHLDIESIIWLERFLRDFEGGLLITSHDREFLNRLVTKVVEIDGGEFTAYSGDYDFYERQRDIAARQQQAQFERQQAMLAKEQAFIDRFKARASHAAQVQSRVKKLEKIERVEPPKRRKVIEFEFRTPPRSGEDVAKVSGVIEGFRLEEGLRESRLADPPPRALVCDGRQRGGEEHPAQAGRRRFGARQRRGGARGQRQARLLRSARHGAAGSRAARCSKRCNATLRSPPSDRSKRSPVHSAFRATTWTSRAACSRVGRRRAWCWL